MKFRGELENIVQDWKEGDFIVSFRVRTVPSGIDKLMDKGLDISVSSHREKRSLSANAYYWVLVSKISDATHQSNAEVHNLLLRRYGVPETIDGELITTFVPEDAEEDILKKEIYHLKPTSFTKTGKDGKIFRAYILMKGSSFFDTKEMSRLIDGATDEAKGMGIEVLPPEEIERMMELYEKHSSN